MEVFVLRMTSVKRWKISVTSTFWILRHLEKETDRAYLYPVCQTLRQRRSFFRFFFVPYVRPWHNSFLTMLPYVLLAACPFLGAISQHVSWAIFDLLLWGWFCPLVPMSNIIACTQAACRQTSARYILTRSMWSSRFAKVFAELQPVFLSATSAFHDVFFSSAVQASFL